jgi:signal transduction histidine kinase
MIARCYSTVDPPPPGFSFIKLGKKELLAAPVMIHARTVDEVLSLLPDFIERVNGVLITVSPLRQWQRLGPLLWHLTTPEDALPELSITLAGVLDAIAAASEKAAQVEDIARRERRSQYDLDVTRRDYLRITGELLKRVAELSDAKEALSRSNEELEARVERRTAELQAANQRLTELDRLKSQFLSNMSHELRTPLNAIIGFTGVLLMKISGPLTAEQDEQLNIVRDSSQHLLSLINDLLDIAKIEAGRMELRLERVDCTHLIGDVIATLQPLALKKGLALNTEVSAEEWCLNTDRRALQQILLNLAGNAIKFTERGSVTIGACISSRDGRSMVEFSVSDTGVGIRPEDRRRLFDVFVRGESGVMEGTGLGLHLSQQYARLLGGIIELESEPGCGSRFALLLPLSAH